MTSTIARERMRRWMESWREVNEAQDELVRSAPTPDPVASLDAGLSLIAFARKDRGANGASAEGREADEASIRRTWQRLREAYVR